MALHTKKLYYHRAVTTYPIDLYTTTAEVGASYFLLRDGGANVYAKVGAVGSTGESHLRVYTSGSVMSVGGSTQPSYSDTELFVDAGDVNSYPGTGTTWYDLAGYNDNVSLVNGPTYSTDGGGSILFDGTNDRADAGIIFPMQNGAMTIEVIFRVNVQNIGHAHTIISNHGGSPFWIGVAVNTASLQFFISGVKKAQTTIPIGSWVMATCTSVNGGLAKCYINGALINSTAATTLVAPSSITSIGYDTYRNAYGLLGNVATAGLFGRAMDDAEVTQRYSAQQARFGF